MSLVTALQDLQRRISDRFDEMERRLTALEDKTHRHQMRVDDKLTRVSDETARLSSELVKKANELNEEIRRVDSGLYDRIRRLESEVDHLRRVNRCYEDLLRLMAPNADVWRKPEFAPKRFI